MPNYDYECSCGVVEEFREYAHRNRIYRCKKCKERMERVWITCAALSNGKYKNKIIREPGIEKEFKRKKEYRLEKFKRKTREVAGKLAQEGAYD